MEVITGLVLILLSSVGARNIPVHMDQPSELPVFDDLPSYTKTPLATIFPTRELVESVVYAEHLGLHLNKNADEVKDYVYRIENLDTDINHQKVSRSNREEEIDSTLRPVEAILGQSIKKIEEGLLEDRVAFEAGCPPGTIRVGDQCWKEH